MKFAIINDIHNGPSTSGFKDGIQRKLTYKAEDLIKEFVTQMNTTVHPEFVVNLGDFIEDVNERETDITYFKKTVELLKPLKMPVYSLIGNHDIRTLTTQDMCSLLGNEQLYYSFDHGDFHFVCLSFSMTGNHTQVLNDIKAEVLPEQIEWVTKDIQKTNKPVIVLIHYGLAEDTMIGNFWFESEPQYALLANRQEVKNIFEKSGKVKAVISGHQHWNKMHVENRIPYFVVTSLVENFRNDGTASEAYTIVNLDKDKIIIELNGNDPAKFQYEFES